jgi:DNA-directed RNA polymerase specialized sigma24 family protein
MLRAWNSWRRKRRQQALALAWCGDPAKAAWLLQETCIDVGTVSHVALYQRMAQLWLQRHAQTGAQAGDECDASLVKFLPGQDPLNHRVRELIAYMPMTQRMTLSLVDVARLSYRETAAVMDIGLFDVQYYVVTARRQLLEELRSGAANHACPDTRETIKSC